MRTHSRRSAPRGIIIRRERYDESPSLSDFEPGSLFGYELRHKISRISAAGFKLPETPTDWSYESAGKLGEEKMRKAAAARFKGLRWRTKKTATEVAEEVEA